MSASTRGRATNSFVACSDTSRPGDSQPLLAAPAVHLARWLTTPSCIHMYARNGAVWFCTARPEGSCSVPPTSALWVPGQSYLELCRLADADQLESVVDELLALSRISWKVVDELLALSALKV